ncbi:piggyBac transposable element-derived protein 3-like [Gigantopelta aegis]|uniref:piggyBac transposable element-derived protein 3-like n=1 Tax=Gigantopelta aegis TaxID=1735272 RepID=UPI001B88CE96|nr:piggyBac transposable element-derived protein 3-like [Gigantopelta aegis]
MGGVDLFDRYLSDYRPSIRGKKWYFPFFTNALNVCATAAWRVHKELGGAETHLVFLRYIVRTLLKQVTTKRCLGTPRSVLPDIRYDGARHNQDKTSKESRCKLCWEEHILQMCKMQPATTPEVFFPVSLQSVKDVAANRCHRITQNHVQTLINLIK